MSILVKISKKRIPYKQAMDMLEKRVNDVKNGKKRELIWMLEHPLTYTGGVRFNKNDILDPNISVIPTNRGGKITLHNPGQLVIYFVIDLNKRKRDIRNFVTVIENSIIECLKDFGLKSNRDKKNIGIWINKKKIAAIGIRVKKWIAYHGCSINVNNNLNDYKKINPCGLNSNDVTSIKNEKKKKIKPNLKKIKSLFVKNISTI